MAKRSNPTLLDKMLDAIKTGYASFGPVDKQTVCSAEPTTYAEANATYALADVALTGTDFTIADGDGAGNTPRKITVGAKSAVTVDSSGTATHVAWIDTVNSILFTVTTCTSQALTAGNTVNIPAWKLEISAPT